MRYVAIDVETTGLDPTKHALLEVACVLEDTATTRHYAVERLPTFHAYVRHDDAVWSSYCLKLHHGKPLWSAQQPGALVDAPVHYGLANLAGELIDWLAEQGIRPDQKGTACGKNFASFDNLFLPERVRRCFRHRVLDPGSVFVDFAQDKLPSLGDLTGREVAHTALEDARDLIRVLRPRYT